MSTAISAASQTMRSVLLNMLQTDSSLGPLFSGPGSAIISLLNPDEMDTAGFTGLSVWLYRIMRDEQLLNSPPERIAPDRVRRTPLPIRLHYLVAPMIGGDGAVPIETRHHLLGAVLRFFHDQPLVSGTDLAGDLAGTSVELAVRLESPPMDELARIWDTLETGYTLSLSYEVSIVSIASAQPDELGVPVTISEPNVGLAVPEAAA